MQEIESAETMNCIGIEVDGGQSVRNLALATVVHSYFAAQRKM